MPLDKDPGCCTPEELLGRMKAEWADHGNVPDDFLPLEEWDEHGVPEMYSDLAVSIYEKHGPATRAHIIAICNDGKKQRLAEIHNGHALQDYRRTLREHQLMHVRFLYRILNPRATRPRTEQPAPLEGQ